MKKSARAISFLLAVIVMSFCLSLGVSAKNEFYSPEATVYSIDTNDTEGESPISPYTSDDNFAGAVAVIILLSGIGAAKAGQILLKNKKEKIIVNKV